MKPPPGMRINILPWTPEDRAENVVRASVSLVWCTQCGKPFSDRACGPTHALIWHEATSAATHDH